MRRLLLTAAGMAALTLMTPGAALAHHHGGKHGHHRHNATFRKHSHGHFRLVDFGTPPSTTSPGSPTTPGSTPTAQGVGKVTSYKNGVLTITLNDGSTVSGKVTGETNIECVGTAQQQSADVVHNGWGGGRGDGDGRGGNQTVSSRGSWMHGGQAGDNGPQSASEPPCDTSALEGAEVRFAELRIGPMGAEFETVVLLRQPPAGSAATTPTTPTTPTAPTAPTTSGTPCHTTSSGSSDS